MPVKWCVCSLAGGRIHARLGVCGGRGRRRRRGSQQLRRCPRLVLLVRVAALAE